MVGLIAAPPRSVLEIGCGAGATAAAIKRKFPGVTCVGVEIDEGAAEKARTRLDRVIVGDIEKPGTLPPDLARESFGLVVCADVLEHLYDPWKTLATLRGYLAPAGRLIASIPNVQNLGLILRLIAGRWDYTSSGLLDSSHIRFFTRSGIQEMFQTAGYRILEYQSMLQRNIDRESWPQDLDFGQVVLRGITAEQALPLFTFQYLVVAEKVG